MTALLAIVALTSPAEDRCRELLESWRSPVCEARLATCERMAGYLGDEGAPVGLGLSLAFHEARFDPAPRRMCSTWQLARRWHCPRCSHAECERAGARVLARLLREERARVMHRRHGSSERRALRRWLRGPDGWRGVDAAGERWIGAVLRAAGE